MLKTYLVNSKSVIEQGRKVAYLITVVDRRHQWQQRKELLQTQHITRRSCLC